LYNTAIWRGWDVCELHFIERCCADAKVFIQVATEKPTNLTKLPTDFVLKDRVSQEVCFAFLSFSWCRRLSDKKSTAARKAVKAISAAHSAIGEAAEHELLTLGQELARIEQRREQKHG